MRRSLARVIKRGALAGGFVAGFSHFSPTLANVAATWLSATSGNWTDATKWSSNPSFPNNLNEDAQIEATGSPYVVSLSLNTPNNIFVHDLDLNAELDIPESAYLDVSGALNLGASGVIQLDGQANQLEIDGSAVNGQGEITFDGSFSGYFGNVDFGVLGGQSTCTFAPGITLTTGTENGEINSGTLINEGTILAKNGRTLVVSLQTNSGLAEANTGGTLYLGGTWTNTGTITASGATIKSYVPTVSAAGNFQVANGRFEFENASTIAAVDALNIQNSIIAIGINAGINDAGTTLNVQDGTNTWHLIGAISGGAIDAPTGVPLEVEKAVNNNSTTTSSLSNVQVNADMVLDTGANLNLNSGTTILGHTIQMDGAILTINSGVVLSNGTSIVLNGGSNNNSLTTTIVPSGVTISTGSGGGTLGNAFSTLAVSGSISSASPGYSLTLTGSAIVNHGLLEAADATIVVPMNPDSIQGLVPTPVSSDGSVDLEAGGLINIKGSYLQSNSGIAVFQLDGTGVGQSGLLDTTSNIQLAGELIVDLAPGYQPNPGDQFQIITTSGGTLSGTFATEIFNTGGENFAVSYGPSSVTLTAVPEPGCFLILSGALGLLLWRQRKPGTLHPDG